MITALHNGFFLSEAPFIPLIGEDENRFSCNAVCIRLPARLADDLNWEEARAQAQQSVADGKLLFWEFDFGLEEGVISLTDQAPFLSFTVAIDQFKASLWKDFEAHSIGASLYRGEIDFLNGAGDEEVLPIDLLAAYLHRLASFLPDALPAFCLFDVSKISNQGLIAKILSKERFVHLHLAVKGAAIPLTGLTWETGSSPGGWIGKGVPSFPLCEEPVLAVCLPSDGALNEKTVERIDLLFEELKSRQIPFRIIPEAFLTEQWDGLDEILVLSSALSPQGKRMLQGFSASGGVAVVIGDPIGVDGETVYPSK